MNFPDEKEKEEAEDENMIFFSTLKDYKCFHFNKFPFWCSFILSLIKKANTTPQSNKQKEWRTKNEKSGWAGDELRKIQVEKVLKNIIYLRWVWPVVK